MRRGMRVKVGEKMCINCSDVELGKTIDRYD